MGRPGLDSTEALRRLRRDISKVLDTVPRSCPRRSTFLDSISLSNRKALVIWPTLCVGFFYGCMLYFTYETSDSKQIGFTLLVEALIIWLLLFLNVLLAYNENKLSNFEIPKRIQYSIDELSKAIVECEWTEDNFPHLCAPFSPCVTLQWTYRDGKIVNLPWALLVEGDIIVMKPGQESPGRCESVEEPSVIMLPQQIFQPSSVNFHGQDNSFPQPRAINPHKTKLFKLLETPYISNLNMALEQALSRPVTVHNKQRYLVVIKCIETIALPGSVMVIIFSGIVRHFYVSEYVGTAHWTTIFLLQLIAATLPLLPLIFPIAWVALNIYGTAKFKHLLQTSNKEELKRIALETHDVRKSLLQSYNSKLLSGNDRTIWRMFFNILIGEENFMNRSANIVQVLGSVTALCCVDKKGILSWPNPTAEKVFFLHNSNDTTSYHSSESSFLDTVSYLSGGNAPEKIEITKPDNQNQISQMDSVTVAEVLDLTHDQNIPFGLEFDDHSWKKHIPCLKPLGLAILLNTCNMDTQEHYAHFCAHLACEATQSEDVVPVTNRRCLCELAKRIGFVEEAKNYYSLQNNLATYRHLPPDIIRRDTKFARSLHLNSRVKVPLPHMLSVIINDQARGLQLFSQGTADIVLDSCIEYWNGKELCVLSASDRKKVLDFYQRSSLTAYCSAFAYRPINRGVTEDIAKMFVELPADCPSLYPTNLTSSDSEAFLTNLYHSTDSLFFSNLKDEDSNRLDGCFDNQSNQIFIGMVTMQYQPQNDIVELIERLEGACIRFVHFSKENELRSRVFSEKMGLESGWNCHISLSSDNNRPSSPTISQTFNINEKLNKTELSASKHSIGPINTLEMAKISNSAPAAINLEHTMVKFGNDASLLRVDLRNNSIVSYHIPSRRESAMQEGSPADGCRSLSCLTDSTDHTVPLNFDMRNRAKLPRGIENIRPHIEQVDNVPLLVSLFTDCTANTARRMISIMQEYNEVVCVMGSAANKDNMEIFMQADASIAVEPLYPVVCQSIPPYQLPVKGIGPIDLARILNSVACSISIPREADISLFTLVTMARHFMLSLWNSMQFWLSAILSLSLLQMLAIVSAMPMIMSIGNVMWLSIVIIPIISIALMCVSVDPTVMKKATYKHPNSLNLELGLFVFWCYGCKFIPSIIIVLFTYATMLMSFCEDIVKFNNGTECIMMYPKDITESISMKKLNEIEEWNGWGNTYKNGYILAQQISFFMLFLLIVTVSVSFVHREYLIWQRNILRNKPWLISVLSLTLIQVLYLVIELDLWNTDSESEDLLTFKVPVTHIILMSVAPIIVLVINELIKWQEINTNLRYQRRARLDFGTKLGMNSPF